MASKRKQTGERALGEILAALAALARQAGVPKERFLGLAAQAYRPAPGTAASPALPFDAGVRLVGRWLGRPFSYRGKARALPRRGKASFAALVRLARAGSPEATLEALAGAGIVRVDPRGHVHLLRREYVPVTGTPEQIEAAGRVGAEFLRLLAHNVGAAAAKRLLQRTASYDNIGGSSIMSLERRLRREGEGAITRANALLASRDRDRNRRAPGGSRTRVTFGVYVFHEPVKARAGKKTGSQRGGRKGGK